MGLFEWLGDRGQEFNNTLGANKNMLGAGASGAASGAAAGSFIPGIGTVIGGLIGGGVGLMSGHGADAAEGVANDQQSKLEAQQRAYAALQDPYAAGNAGLQALIAQQQQGINQAYDHGQGALTASLAGRGMMGGGVEAGANSNYQAQRGQDLGNAMQQLTARNYDNSVNWNQQHQANMMNQAQQSRDFHQGQSDATMNNFGQLAGAGLNFAGQAYGAQQAQPQHPQQQQPANTYQHNYAMNPNYQAQSLTPSPAPTMPRPTNTALASLPQQSGSFARSTPYYRKPGGY